MYDLTLTTVFLSALNSLLLIMAAFFIKAWFNHVNSSIKSSTAALIDLNVLKTKVGALENDFSNIKSDIRAIRDIVTSHVTKATAP